ncbi:hypothetical protein [Chryseobacterium hagamense]|uniref:Secretion system C-terminal sorting domain-containing protein n=1 Tax=Chryseobacterium hagamense TaxID=395935 RepID=A0A511YPP8_9FLAO|nr:hypothetical protein [Chryseobacterium hagamense]GEN77156.1 hypothetical protein CHA01nite_28960 [Chryseobacterium hagamense]
MKKSISTAAIFLFFGSSLYAQSVIFGYDEAGNQIFRGICDGCKNSDSNLFSRKQSQESQPKTIAEKVEKSIRAAPVPVKTDLTVLWDEEVKDYITRIELLPYNSFKILSFADVSTLNKTSYVFHMENYPYGVYYLKFYLSDGSIYTRTVTKN